MSFQFVVCSKASLVSFLWLVLRGCLRLLNLEAPESLSDFSGFGFSGFLRDGMTARSDLSARAQIQVGFTVDS